MSDERDRVTGRLFPFEEPGSRPCCLLSTQQGLSLPIPIIDHLIRALGPESVIDTGDLQHKLGTGGWGYFVWKTERSGLVYTRRGGFIDLAHLRDHIDITLDYYRELLKARRGNLQSFSPAVNDKISIRILRRIPDDQLVTVAQSMAFDQSIFHEIDTYWNPTLPFHIERKSAFSPEDLVSNFLGVVLGGRVIRRILESENEPEDREFRFNAVATVELTFLLDSECLDAVSKEDTYRALGIVEDEWFDIPPPPARDFFVPNSWLPDYLQRRNFNWRPIRAWALPIRDGRPDREGLAATWPRSLERELPAEVRSYYEVSYRAPDPRLGYEPESESAGGGRVDSLSIPRARERDWFTSEFAAEIERIEDDARTRFGLQYKEASPASPLDVEE